MSNDNGIITAIVINIISLIAFFIFLSYNVFYEKGFKKASHTNAYPLFFVILIIFSIVFGLSYMSKKDSKTDEDKYKAEMYLGLLIINSVSLIPIIIKFYFILF